MDEPKKLYKVLKATVVGEFSYEEGQTYELSDSQAAAFAAEELELVATPDAPAGDAPATGDAPAGDAPATGDAPAGDAPATGDAPTAPAADAPTAPAPAEPWAGRPPVGRE